jgi:hypothetical protein
MNIILCWENHIGAVMIIVLALECGRSGEINDYEIVFAASLLSTH